LLASELVQFATLAIAQVLANREQRSRLVENDTYLHGLTLSRSSTIECPGRLTREANVKRIGWYSTPVEIVNSEIAVEAEALGDGRSSFRVEHPLHLFSAFSS
jgi:hypothetical protein